MMTKPCCARQLTATVFLTTLLALAGVLTAQTPYLFKDINTTTADAG